MYLCQVLTYLYYIFKISFLLQTGRCVHPFGKKSKLRKPINTWRYPLIQSHHYFMPKNGRVDVEIYVVFGGVHSRTVLSLGSTYWRFCSKKDLRKSKGINYSAIINYKAYTNCKIIIYIFYTLISKQKFNH